MHLARHVYQSNFHSCRCRTLSQIDLVLFYFAPFWTKKLISLSRPVSFKTKTNRDLVAPVFPRFKQFVCFYFEFS